ncbi:hypothetical protein Tco_1098103, partial [Tanacetum coccineum]
MCPCDDASLVALRFSLRGNSGGGCESSEGGLFHLSLLKTLAIGDGLQECLFPCLLLGSVRAVGVLDSNSLRTSSDVGSSRPCGPLLPSVFRTANVGMVG